MNNQHAEESIVITVHELAGKVEPITILANISRLVSAYYTCRPEVKSLRIVRFFCLT